MTGRTVAAPRALPRLGAVDWGQVGARVRGPLLTLATMIVFDQLARRGMQILQPFAFLLLGVVYSAYRGGLKSALISALLVIVYAVHFFAESSAALRYSPPRAYSLVAVCLVVLVTAVLVARLKQGAERAEALELGRADVLARERRHAFFAEASRLLASSLDHEATLRSLARLVVPNLADWCAIHVVGDGAALRFVAGAHRDPAKDLVVRALCEYPSPNSRPPFGPPPSRPELAELDEEGLCAVEPDPERRKLCRALTPTGYVRVPLEARGRLLGVITLVTAAEYGRQFGEEDLEAGVALASRAALALDGARLHREAEEAAQRARLLFEGHAQPMWVFDVETLAFLAVNDAAVRHYGYSREEFLGMTIMDLRPPDDAPGYLSTLERPTHREGVAVAQHQTRDGTVIEVELSSHAFELDGRAARLVLVTDLTERARAKAALHRTEEQLRHVQRLGAVGRLAGGIAHDFNNILTTIRGFSDMLLASFEERDPRRRDAEQIAKAADRGALLTRQLLAFGQRQTLQPRPLDLNGLVQGMEGLIQRLVGADIRVETRLAPGLGRVRMDPGQLEQVLVNLVLNARDAMPAGGTLRLETAERQVTRSARTRSIRPGRYAVLAASDTGSGMEPDTLARAFEPFYTTKAPGQGAGLGLSIAYGIVRQSGGVIRVSSAPGEGTTVKVYLPLLDEPEGVEAPIASLRGSETVLVVDDEDGVRALLRKIFSEHGHTVLEARHGRDALLAVEQLGRPVDLLVTDVVMPEMGGGELVEELRSRYPELKVLYISGYTDDELVHRGVARTEVGFLAKPFTPEALMRRARQLLDGAAVT